MPPSPISEKVKPRVAVRLAEAGDDSSSPARDVFTDNFI